MSKSKFVTISLLLITTASIIFLVGNLPNIYADRIYKYEPCLNEKTATTAAIFTPTTAPYPIGSTEAQLNSPYPGPSLSTATPIICSCESDWATASFSVLTVQYPIESLRDMDSETMSLRMPTCQGSKHSGFITLEIIENNENTVIEDYVEQIYSGVQKVKSREILVDGANSIEVYETEFSKNRIVFIPHQGKIIIIRLNVSSRMMVPDRDGQVWINELDWGELGFFQKVLGTIELTE